MKPVVRTDEAESDIMLAALWYENQKEDLGAKFLDRVDEAVSVIARNPEGPQEVITNLRHVQLRKFKAYGLWYTCGDEILVLACVHGRRQLGPLVRGRFQEIGRELR